MMALPKKSKTETMSVSESRKQYSELLNRVYRDQEQVIIEKNGIPVAAIVPISTMKDAESRASRRADLQAALEATRAEFRDIPPEEIEAEIAKAISDVEKSRRERPMHNTTSDKS
jgi:prevent-host-death family protein